MALPACCRACSADTTVHGPTTGPRHPIGTSPAPERCATPNRRERAVTAFAHSAVLALNQRMVPLISQISLIRLAELERNPTVKAETEATGWQAMSGLLLT